MLASVTLLVLSIAAVVSVAAGLTALRTIRRCGPGAVQEDLDSMRHAGRVAIASVLVLSGSLISLPVLAVVWAPEWRGSALGITVLNSLLGLLGVAFLCACGQATFHQWSSRGSTKGLAGWTVAGLAIGAVFLLIGYWRSG